MSDAPPLARIPLAGKAELMRLLQADPHELFIPKPETTKAAGAPKDTGG